MLCLYKTDNDCVMKFTYSEHASGRSVLTALKEPGQCSTQQQVRCSVLFNYTDFSSEPSAFRSYLWCTNQHGSATTALKNQSLCSQAQTCLTDYMSASCLDGYLPNVSRGLTSQCLNIQICLCGV